MTPSRPAEYLENTRQATTLESCVTHVGRVRHGREQCAQGCTTEDTNQIQLIPCMSSEKRNFAKEKKTRGGRRERRFTRFTHRMELWRSTARPLTPSRWPPGASGRGSTRLEAVSFASDQSRSQPCGCIRLTVRDPLVAEFSCHTCSWGRSVKTGIAEEMRSLSAACKGRSHVYSGENDVTMLNPQAHRF